MCISVQEIKERLEIGDCFEWISVNDFEEDASFFIDAQDTDADGINMRV